MNKRTFVFGIVVVGMMLVAQIPRATAWCLFSCDPTQQHARTVLENWLRSNVRNAPFKITHFEKTNGSKVSGGGVEGYQLFYRAVVEFPSGIQPGRSQKNVWQQLGGMGSGFEAQTSLREKGFRVTKGDKVDEFTVMESNSALVFQKTEQGWMGEDGQIYKP